MSRKKYNWHKTDHPNNLFGMDLAKKVATYLLQGNQIAYTHRDYCGMGLAYYRENFVYGFVQDGYDFYIEQTFPLQTAFENWLANQSDESLSGKELEDSWFQDNQRIYQKRLEESISTPNPQTTMGNFFIKKGNNWEILP